MSCSAVKVISLKLLEPVHVGEVCSSALRALHFTRITADDKMQRVDAEKQDTIKGRFSWSLNYHAVLDWSSTQSETEVSIEVTESSSTQSQEQCKDYCEQITARILRDQEKFLKLKSTRVPSDLYGAAAWATHDELVSACYLLGRGGERFTVLGPVTKLNPDATGIYAVPEKYVDRHTLVCGPTGSGKTQGFFIPNLLMRLGESAIVTEATPGGLLPDLYSKTAGWRQMEGKQKIFLFDPASTHTHCFNPIDEVRKASAGDVKRRADELADRIIANTSGKGTRSDPAFDRSEKLLLLSLILFVARLSPSHAHLGSVRRLLRQGPDGIIRVLNRARSQSQQMEDSLREWHQEIDKVFSSVSKEERQQYFKDAEQEFSAWYNNTREGFRYAVAGGLLSRLNPWLTDAAIAMTSKSDFEPQELLNESFTIYLSAPIGRPDLKLLSALLFSNFLTVVRQYPFSKPVALFLDEFTNFGRIDGMHETLSIIRKMRIPICLGMQDFAQLCEVYTPNQAQIIASQPATRIFYKPNEKTDTHKLSQSLGTMTYEEERLLPGGTVVIDRRPRQLMTTDEIDRMKSDEIIVFAPDIGKAKLTRFPDAYFKKCWTEVEVPLPEIPELSAVIQTLHSGISADVGDNTVTESLVIPVNDVQDRLDREDRFVDDVPIDIFEGR